MIISASRRTDIPAFYSQWFYKRIEEGYVLVRNPFNYHFVSKVSLDKKDVECIVFWTKYPEPMISGLDLLRDYGYYFLFTLNPYGNYLEKRLPPKDDLVNSFIKLAEKIGRHRVVWRYDPIVLSDILTLKYHLREFQFLAAKLGDFTEKCIISFLEPYSKTKRNIKGLSIKFPDAEEKKELAGNLAQIAVKRGIKLEICAQGLDLHKHGIERAKCIDNRLISRITNQPIKEEKDKNQRKECRCVSSVDIGAYNTCLHNCLYCYANYSREMVSQNVKLHNPHSPLLIGELNPEDKIRER